MGLCCSSYVSGCRSVQRDFLQAPPAVESQSSILSIKSTDPWALAEAAMLSQARYHHVPILVGPRARLYRVGQGANLDGLLLLATVNPDRPGEIAIEARFGTFGHPATEREYVDSLAGAMRAVMNDTRSGIAADSTQVGRVGITLHATESLSGRWIDLDDAINAARVTKKTIEGAVISIDRWRFATIYELRTLDDKPATLVVIGDVQSDAGPRLAMMRIGHFDDHGADETAFLKRLRTELAKLARSKRWSGSR